MDDKKLRENISAKGKIRRPLQPIKPARPVKPITEQVILQILSEIEKRTEREAFSITVKHGKRTALCDSKFGGVPYWDRKKKYPVDKEGNKLMLLAQFNLAKLETNEILPRTGLLQFFIAVDDDYGLNYAKPDQQDTFRVVYHKTIDRKITRKDVLKLGIPYSSNSKGGEACHRPVSGELAVDIKKTKVSMGICDYQFDRLFRLIATEKRVIIPKGKDVYSLLSDQTIEKLTEKNAGHWLLGYPIFSQEDPRGQSEDLEYYNTLLFQMDSDYDAQNVDKQEDQIMWGDAGVGNFFMNSEDLQNGTFNKVMYTWDCY